LKTTSLGYIVKIELNMNLETVEVANKFLLFRLSDKPST